MKTLNDIAKAAYENAKAKGFHDNDLPNNGFVPEKIALIHSEASEALEAYREGEMVTVIKPNGKPEGFPSELADVVIRVANLAAQMGINLDLEVEMKMKYNATRPPMHGGKKC